MDAPSTTTASLTSVEVAHLTAEIVGQLTDAKVVVCAFDSWLPYMEVVEPSIRLFLDTQTHVDCATSMFDLTRDDAATYYESNGTVRGVKIHVWSSRDEVTA